MTIDNELETWRKQWHTDTEPLPQLKRKIKRQNLRIAAAVVAVCVCLALSTIEALRTRTAFAMGLASGIAFAGVFLGGYAWWVRRGAWRPSAQNTLAYTELSYKRAVAREKSLNFSFYFLLVATTLMTAFVAWNWKGFHGRDGAIVIAMVLEMFLFRRMRRRKLQEIAETKKLIDDMKE
ncbi:MAG TPA: hypothetical protein VIK39_02255 [Candidatus Angelobacter sp.]